MVGLVGVAQTRLGLCCFFNEIKYWLESSLLINCDNSLEFSVHVGKPVYIQTTLSTFYEHATKLLEGNSV